MTETGRKEGSKPQAREGQRLVQRHDERQDCETPPDLFLSLLREFGPFDVDVAAHAGNAKVPRFFGSEIDGLAQEWTGRCWMNPPYGRGTGRWVKKASEARALVVCLLPARTDTKWFHDYVLPKAKVVRWLKGRVNFWLDGRATTGKDGRPSGGKFPSMVVVFDGRA